MTCNNLAQALAIERICEEPVTQADVVSVRKHLRSLLPFDKCLIRLCGVVRLALPLWCLWIPIAKAQKPTCDQLTPLAGSQLQYKDRGNRCEGLYVANVGSKTLEVISFIEGNLHFDLSMHTIIHVFTRNKTGPVHVRAVAKPPRTYYRMDALLEASSPLEWPVDDVLRPANLNADRLGILAWKDDQGERLLMPVRVTVNSQPAVTTTNVYLTLRSSFDVDSLKWRSAQRNQGNCAAFGPWKDITRNQILAGEPVKLDLSTLKGASCVQLAAQSANSNEWSTLTLRMELPE